MRSWRVSRLEFGAAASWAGLVGVGALGEDGVDLGLDGAEGWEVRFGFGELLEGFAEGVGVDVVEVGVVPEGDGGRVDAGSGPDDLGCLGGGV